MIGVLILAQDAMGSGLVAAATHILGTPPLRVEVLAVDDACTPPETLTAELDETLARLDDGGGVLILADIYGASHTNTACRVAQGRRVELVAGVSLPMLIRVLNHRDLTLTELVGKATSGGTEGIVCSRDRPK